MSNVFDAIREKVCIFDLFDEMGMKYGSREKSAKLSCIFHGLDKRKSGYVFHDTNTFRCYVCNRSWDVIDFWAQANQWFKEKDGEEVLDVGRAIADLSERYRVDFTAPDWQETYYKLRNQVRQPPKSFASMSEFERVKMRDYYVWKIGLLFAGISREGRESLWPCVREVWDSLDMVDLTSDTWKSDLNSWVESAKMVVTHEPPL